MEYVILVDEKDNEIGTCEKIEAHEKALLHRAFSVCVLRNGPRGQEILLQKRADHKYHCGGLWTNTCCSHPRLGESTLDAAKRRLDEELGFSLELEHQGQFIYKAPFDNGLTEYELDHVFVGQYSNESIELNPDEVSGVNWVLLVKLIEDVQANPNNYTPWLKPVLEAI